MNKTIFSSLRLRQIINDLKRRPIDASKDLKISLKKFNQYLNGNKKIDEKFVGKAVTAWPVKISDFINPHFHKTNQFKIYKAADSLKTSRIMKRGGINYYEYRDTVMDRDAPFRPEWIRDLVYLETNSPYENKLHWNKGHLMHQLTYFVGKVNFYYLDKNNQKKTAIMNTGDSMYIAPYAPHTFASRDKNCRGFIIAITFSDKINTDIQNEISKLNYSKVSEIIFKNKFENTKKVTIKKYPKKIKNNNSLKIITLAKNKIIPSVNFLEINVYKNNNKNFYNNYHQYLYVLSKKAKLKLENQHLNLKENDTVYCKPFTNLKVLKKKTKILIAQVESNFNLKTIKQLYYIGNKNIKRLIKDNTQWFKE